MPVVPLGLQSYQRSAAFVPEVVLLNMFTEKDISGLSPDETMRIKRPGLVRRFGLPGTMRAMRWWPSKGQFVYVTGGAVFLNQTRIGSVASDVSSIAVTTLAAGIVAGGQFYITTGGAVTQVVLPDGRVAIDVEQLNGYFLVLTDTGRFYWLVPGETEIDPLDFATAESSGDGGRAICRINDELLIFGVESTEVWQATGDADAPFQRAVGRLYQRGALHRLAVRRFDNAIIWVGDDGTVYRLGAVPQAISTPAIDERIRRRAGIVSAWTFKVDGHDFYVLTIPGEGTFAYDASTQLWSEFTWNVRVGETVDGVTTAAADGGSVYTVSMTEASDAGQAFECAVTATVGFMGAGPRNDSVSIGVGSDQDCTVRLRWKDGQDDYPDYYEEVEARAPLDVATIYRLGQPDQPYRTFEVSCIDPVRFRIAGMMANESWQGGNG